MYVMMAQTFSLVCNSLGEMNTVDVTNLSSEFNPLIYHVCIPLCVRKLVAQVICMA